MAFLKTGAEGGVGVSKNSQQQLAAQVETPSEGCLNVDYNQHLKDLAAFRRNILKCVVGIALFELLNASL